MLPPLTNTAKIRSFRDEKYINKFCINTSKIYGIVDICNENATEIKTTISEEDKCDFGTQIH